MANGTGPGGSSTWVDLLRWRTAVQPDALAFSFLLDGEAEAASFTYAELDHQARRIAAYLQSVANPGERAVLLLPPGLEYRAAFFGCLYAGIVLVPAQPPRPDQGLATLQTAVDVTDATLVLTTSPILAALEPHLHQVPGLRQLRWESLDAIPSGLESAWREPSISADTLAALLVTSGSTGVPKAAMHTHDTMMNWVAQLAVAQGYTHESVEVSFFPPHFGAAIGFDTLMPLYAGVPTILMPMSGVLQRPMWWLETLSRTRATHTGAMNFAFELCTQAAGGRDLPNLDLSNLAFVGIGGEANRFPTLERFAATFRPYGFQFGAYAALYALTEGTVISTGRRGTGVVVAAFDKGELEHNRVRVSDAGGPESLTLIGAGEPIPSRGVVIVDPYTRLRCQPGEVGEIWATGPSIAKGYWNRPEETEDTFRAFLADTGEGPYLRTGDLGFLHSGELFISGRLKEVIIIRGRNLSPLDLEEAAWQSHPSLRPASAAAFAVDVDDEEQLVVVQEVDPELPDQVAVTSAIRQGIAQRHQVQPYAVVLIPAGTLLRTSSGKIQRRGCRDAFLEDRLTVVARSIRDAPGDGERGPLRSPRTPIEETLAVIWSQALRLERVGIDENFFALGGDSLTSMQVIAMARQAGLHLTVSQLAERQTIAQLAEVVGAAPTIEAEQGLVVGPSPLLPTQARFFDLMPQQEAHLGFYRIISVSEHLDPDVFRQALQHVLEHHDALRARFVHDGAGWHQTFLADEPHHILSSLDLSWLPREQRQAAIDAAGEQLYQTLDLAAGPLVRVSLIDLGPEEPSTMILVVHHLVTDAISNRVLLEDLEIAYRQLQQGSAVQLPSKTTSLKAWAERLAVWANSPELRRELDYWLSDARQSVAPLPVDPSIAGWGSGHQLWLSRSETTVLVRDIPLRYGTEITDVLLTALVHAFAGWTGRRSLLIDLVSHGRDPIFPELDVSRTVGWLANFFPVLLELGPVAELEAELLAIKEQLRAIPNRGLGYGVLRYVSTENALVERLRTMPQPEVRFNYTGTFNADAAESHLFGSGAPSWASSAPAGEAGHAAFWYPGEEPEFLVSGQIVGGQLMVQLQSGRVFRDPDLLEHLARSYLAALQDILATCGERTAMPAPAD